MIDIRNDFPSSKEFIATYWGKKPLLVRGFLKDAASLISPDELAGLSLESEVESRMIIESTAKDAQSNWQVNHGPFEESVFTELPESHWSLLVQGVDRFMPKISNLCSFFDFIPNWRFDDVMVSYSAPGGGVGPHYDLYDVFLIQGLGERVWQLGARKEEPTAELVPDIPLKILANYQYSLEVKVQAGDVLYIPPMWSHNGISISEAITYSVGFRAPPLGELLYRSAFELATSIQGERLFEDRRFQGQIEPGEISSQSVEDALSGVIDLIKQKDLFAACFGSYVTEPKEVQDDSGAISIKVGKDEPLCLSQLGSPDTRSIIAKAPAYRLEGGRFAFYRGDSELLFFAEGQVITLPLSLKDTVAKLCKLRVYDENILVELAYDNDASILLGYCFERGWIYTEA